MNKVEVTFTAVIDDVDDEFLDDDCIRDLAVDKKFDFMWKVLSSYERES